MPKSNRDFAAQTLRVEFQRLQRDTARVVHAAGAATVHDVRVAAMRVAFGLKFFEDYLNVQEATLLKDRLKQARDKMGKARNWDIMWERVPEREIRSLVFVRRSMARKELKGTLKSSWYKRIFGHNEELILKDLKDNHHAQDLLEAEAQKFLRWQRKRIRRKDLHQVRISFKKLRYACEFTANFYKIDLHRIVALLEKFQDVLGERQDALSMKEQLVQLREAGQRIPQKIIKRQKREVQKAESRFERLWNKYSPETLIRLIKNA